MMSKGLVASVSMIMTWKRERVAAGDDHPQHSWSFHHTPRKECGFPSLEEQRA